MYLTLGQAAKEVGKSKGTLSKAVKDGKLSVAKKDENGSFQIDPAELFRVFPKQEERNRTGSNEQDATPISPKNSDIEQGNGSLERAYVSTIEDLRRRLDDAERRSDRERQEAREEREKLFLLLEHKPADKTEPEPEIPTAQQAPRHRWWQRKKKA